MMHWLDRHRRQTFAASAYAVMLCLLSGMVPGFVHQQLVNSWVEASPMLVAGIGMTLLILAREIDISIGAIFAAGGTIAAMASRAGLPLPLAFMAALLAGAAVGAANGAMVAIVNLPSIVVTLATMMILRGALIWIGPVQSNPEMPVNLRWFSLSQRDGDFLLILISLGLLAAFAFLLNWVAAGRAIYAVGSDRERARLAGLRPRRVVFVIFVVMGAMAALAGLLQAVRFPLMTIPPDNGIELQVIAAVIVGGTAIFGGRGSLLGTLLGVALLTTLRPAFAALHMDVQWDRAVEGGIILLAVALDGWREKRRPA